jgi:hypothetical protein
MEHGAWRIECGGWTIATLWPVAAIRTTPWTIFAMSKIVKSGITYFFLAMIQKIYRGRIVPTVIGAILGGSVGSLAWHLHSSLMPAGIFLGLVLGAGLAATIFPKPQAAPTPDETRQEP